MISSAQPSAKAVSTSIGIRHQVSPRPDGMTEALMLQGPRREVKRQPGQPDQGGQTDAAEQVGAPAGNGPARHRAGLNPVRHNR